jgi:SPP1 gp7 family putative phage head morphogenesis protein
VIISKAMNEHQFALVKEIASGNLLVWKGSGFVKSLRCYSAEDDAVCPECAKHNGAIIRIEDAKTGENLPPLSVCRSGHCRCYSRPWDISPD